MMSPRVPIPKPAGNTNYVNDVYHEIKLDGLLTLTAEAAQHFGQPTAAATLLFQGNGNACLEVNSFQRWLLIARFPRNILHGVGKLVEVKY